MQSEQNQSDTYMLLYSRNEASENNRSGPTGMITTTTNTVSGASGGNIGFDVDPSEGRRTSRSSKSRDHFIVVKIAIY